MRQRAVNKYTLISFVMMILVFICLPINAEVSETSSKTKKLEGGWFLYDPFQFEKIDSNQYIRLTGFDIELQRLIAKNIGYKINFNKISWQQHIKEIKSGKLDIAGMAIKTPEREKFAHFSIPYRKETNSLYMLSENEDAFQADTIEQLIALIEEKKYKIGIIEGYQYTNPKINVFISNPSNKQYIIKVENDYENVEKLINKQIDAFWSDVIAASTIIWRKQYTDEISKHHLESSANLHFMFSKRSVSEEVVEAFNQSIKKIKGGDAFRDISIDYMYPVLLEQTIDSDWFKIVDIIGTIAFIISGILIATRLNYDIFGALVLAAAPAVGGGIIRDLITNRNPIGVLSDPIYIQLIISIVIIYYLLLRTTRFLPNRYRARFKEFILNLNVFVFDAIGLAAFTVTGVVVAFITNVDPIWIWGPVLAAITCCGGGIIRDIITSYEIYILKGELYPEIAFVWGLFLSLFIMFLANNELFNTTYILYGVVVTMIGAFLTKILTKKYGITSLMYR